MNEATLTDGTAGSSGEELSLSGLLLEFDAVDPLLAAVEKVRDAGFKQWDVHTPFPVHGCDEAMGIKPTRLPFISLAGGLAGATGALALQWWTNAVDYPFLISGKPLFSLPANVPVIFELTVLLSALGAFIGMLALNGLPQLYHPLFTNSRFRRATDDRFFIYIEAADPRFDPLQTREFLSSLGGSHIEEVRG